MESSMTVKSITTVFPVLLGLAALPWFALVVWNPLICQCPQNFSEENCNYANAYCLTKGLHDADLDPPVSGDSSVKPTSKGLEMGFRIFIILFGVLVLLLLPDILKKVVQVWRTEAQISEPQTRLIAVCSTVLAFMWLELTLQTSFALSGWHWFRRIWRNDSQAWNIFTTMERTCSFKARFYAENLEKTEVVEEHALKCAFAYNAWLECVFFALWASLVILGFRHVVKAVRGRI